MLPFWKLRVKKIRNCWNRKTSILVTSEFDGIMLIASKVEELVERMLTLELCCNKRVNGLKKSICYENHLFVKTIFTPTAQNVDLNI